MAVEGTYKYKMFVQVPLRRNHPCINSWARMEPVSSLQLCGGHFWFHTNDAPELVINCQRTPTFDSELYVEVPSLSEEWTHLGSPYKTRIAVTSHLRVSFCGWVLISSNLCPPILGLLSICKKPKPHKRVKRMIYWIIWFLEVKFGWEIVLTLVTVCSSERHRPLVSGMWWGPCRNTDDH
jgi:hypothetical protein